RAVRSMVESTNETRRGHFLIPGPPSKILTTLMTQGLLNPRQMGHFYQPICILWPHLGARAFGHCDSTCHSNARMLGSRSRPPGLRLRPGKGADRANALDLMALIANATGANLAGSADQRWRSEARRGGGERLGLAPSMNLNWQLPTRDFHSDSFTNSLA